MGRQLRNRFFAFARLHAPKSNGPPAAHHASATKTSSVRNSMHSYPWWMGTGCVAQARCASSARRSTAPSSQTPATHKAAAAGCRAGSGRRWSPGSAGCPSPSARHRRSRAPTYSAASNRLGPIRPAAMPRARSASTSVWAQRPASSSVTPKVTPFTIVAATSSGVGAACTCAAGRANSGATDRRPT